MLESEGKEKGGGGGMLLFEKREGGEGELVFAFPPFDSLSGANAPARTSSSSLLSPAPQPQISLHKR